MCCVPMMWWYSYQLFLMWFNLLSANIYLWGVVVRNSEMKFRNLPLPQVERWFKILNKIGCIIASFLRACLKESNFPKSLHSFLGSYGVIKLVQLESLNHKAVFRRDQDLTSDVYTNHVSYLLTKVLSAWLTTVVCNYSQPHPISRNQWHMPPG